MTRVKAGRTRIGVHGVIGDDAGRLLAVRVAPTDPEAGDVAQPEAGRWTLPGGGLRFGEDPAAAVRREVLEETGLETEIEAVERVDARLIDRSVVDGLPVHAIRIVYRLRATGGDLRDEPAGSTDRAAWYALDELAQLPRTELLDIVLAAAEDGRP